MASSTTPVTRLPTWFGDGAVPLFGVWHLPGDRRATSAAVLCPPLGREHNVSYRAFRVLADRLAEAGVATLRFAFAGTGDSADLPPGRRHLDQWVDDVRVALGHARDSGADHVTLLGLRVGALVAARALDEGPSADALVLWDPYPTGRAFLRQERALRLMTLNHVAPEAVPGGFEGIAFVYTPDMVADLGALTFAPAPSAPTLLLERPGASPDAIFPGADAALVERATADDAAEFIAAPDQYGQLPVRGIAGIVDWIAARPTETAAAAIDPKIRTSVELAGTDGRTVTEEVVEIGPRRLFAIVCRPDSTPLGTVVFAPTADHYHAGVARVAVDAGRDLARRGYAAVRYDAEDLGDSPAGSSPDGPMYYTPERLVELDDVLRWCRGTTNGGAIATLGLCSGAWTAAIGAQSTPVDAVYLLNPIVWTRKAVPIGPVVSGVRTWRTDLVQRGATLYRRAQESPVLKVVTDLLWGTLVALRWRVPTTLGLQDGPTRLLDSDAVRSVPITLLLSPREQEVIVERSALRGPRRLRSSPHLRFVDTELEDHSLLSAALRSTVLESLPQWLAADLDQPVTAR